jgi:hypothetical protein
MPDWHCFVDRLQLVGERRGMAAVPIVDPGLHELARRIDFEELALDGVGLAVRRATACSPMASDAYVGAPLFGSIGFGRAPPRDDVARIGERAKDTPGCRRNLDGSDDDARREIDDGSGR